MIRACAHDACRRTFHPKRSDAAYCSDTCRAIASRKRRMAERRKELDAKINEQVAAVAVPTPRGELRPAPALQAPRDIAPPRPSPASAPVPAPRWREEMEARLYGVHDFARQTSDQVERVEARVRDLEAFAEALSGRLLALHEDLVALARALE